jgi:hypothetical protein
LDLVHFLRPNGPAEGPPLDTTLVCLAHLFNYNCGVKDWAVDIFAFCLLGTGYVLRQPWVAARQSKSDAVTGQCQ